MKLILPVLLICCIMASCSKNNDVINAAAIDNSPSAMIPANVPSLSVQDSVMIVNIASKVSPEIKAEFERKRTEWNEYCYKSGIILSSSMEDYTKPEQFTELIAMGEPIIPLVVERMADGDFFMQLVYEGIRPDEKIANSYSSGQQRAADYVLTWVQNAKRQAK